MTYQTAARQEVHPRRATRQTDIVNEHLQKEWEKGCFWAGVALVLTFGPMIGIGIYLNWI